MICARLNANQPWRVTVTERGFTGHEHLDDTYLIHMNGRVYDYRLGRFLSVDPIISNSLNTQSVNAYSYLGNNPLSGVDSTGYACDDFSTARCDTILVNPPDLQPTIPKFIRIGDNGKIIDTSSLNMNAPASSLLAPGHLYEAGSQTGQQVASSSTMNAEQRERLKGALALSTGEAEVVQKSAPWLIPVLSKCAQDMRCVLGITGLVAGGWLIWRATNSDDHPSSPTATDATGALKPEESAPTPSPKPEAGGSGAVSRGPGDPGRFANDAKLVEHFDAHKKDFGVKTPAEYEELARRFLTGPKPEGVLQKTRANGDVVRYRQATEEYGVITNSGIIRTYFKPDPAIHGFATNLDYFYER